MCQIVGLHVHVCARVQVNSVHHIAFESFTLNWSELLCFEHAYQLVPQQFHTLKLVWHALKLSVWQVICQQPKP